MAFLGLLGLVIYGVAIPVHLFRRLKKESQDEAEQRFDPDFMESHGWLVRYARVSVTASHIQMLNLSRRCCATSRSAGGLSSRWSRTGSLSPWPPR